MTYQPVVPLSGYTGWRFLQRTLDAQQTAFNESAPVARATDYFRQEISKIQSADDLVKDRRLLSVALGAFGLDDDINNTFFIKKVLEEGIIADDTLANRLSDKRYAALASGFSFDFAVPRTNLTFFADEIIGKFEARQFEQAVGETDNDMRFALNLESGLSGVIEENQSQNAQWFAMMGNPPLRRVFEQALGLPKAIGQIDIDRQLIAFKDRANATFGTDDLSEFSDLETQEKLIRLFLVRGQLDNSSSLSGHSIALSLLQGR